MIILNVVYISNNFKKCHDFLEIFFLGYMASALSPLLIFILDFALMLIHSRNLKPFSLMMANDIGMPYIKLENKIRVFCWNFVNKNNYILEHYS